MTKRECAIVMAYTGICMLENDDLEIYYNYISELFKRPVWTHELGTFMTDNEIKLKAGNDFMKLCKEATD